MTAPTIAALLDVARGLVAQRSFDVEDVLKLLSRLPLDDVDVQVRGAIKHAQLTAEAAKCGGVGLIVVARFALAHVVTLLEAEVGFRPSVRQRLSRSKFHNGA